MNSRNIFIALLIVILTSFILLLTSCSSYLFEKPDPPEIEYGEFPFKISYKLNGEVYTVEGVYICEYKGISWNEGTGYNNEWDGHIKDTEDEYLFITEQDGIKLYCTVGSESYYMGFGNYTEPYEPFLFCEYQELGGITSTVRKEYLEKFDIELLEWELSEPLIKNDD